MKDPGNPTTEDIRLWAYDPETTAPEQDWDIIISSDSELHSLFVRLADDDSCPKALFFLRVLYLIIGDSVRTKSRSLSKDAIAVFLAASVPNCTTPELQLWYNRSVDLLNNPAKFDYSDWCEGGLAAPQIP